MTRERTRPEHVTQAYVVEMLTCIFDHVLPPDLMPPLLAYLTRKGVVEEKCYNYQLPEGQGCLATYPIDARAHLRRAITAHATSDSCPDILRESLSLDVSEGPSSLAPSRPDIARIQRALWDRDLHVAALRDFGFEHADRMFEAITCRMAGKCIPPVEQPSPDTRTQLERSIDALTISTARMQEHHALRAARAEEHRRWILADLDLTTDPSDSADTTQVGLPSAPPSAVPIERASGPAVAPVPVTARRRRPTVRPDGIDATAVSCLKDAMEAAKSAGEHYLPSRADVARAVSKILGYEIRVHSLFATKATPSGRLPRYPDFIEFWGKVQTMSARIRAAHRSRQKKQPRVADA